MFQCIRKNLNEMFSDNTRRKIITKSSRFTALSTIKEYDSEQKLSKAEFFSSSTLWDEFEAKDKFSYNFLRQFFFSSDYRYGIIEILTDYLFPSGKKLDKILKSGWKYCHNGLTDKLLSHVCIFPLLLLVYTVTFFACHIPGRVGLLKR